MATAELDITRSGQQIPVIKSARDLVGTFRDPEEINARLAWAAHNCNLISPESSIGRVPEGFAVCIKVVPIGENDYYPLDLTERQFCLNRQGTNRIAREAQVSWHSGLTRRLDNGRNPRYSQFAVGGTYRGWDTTTMNIGATRHLNLSDGSEKVQEIYDQANGDTRRAQLFIRRMRAFIHEYVESLAKSRAMQDCGVLVSYTREQIVRPFVVAKLVWTAQSDDPLLQRDFQRMQAQAALAATHSLYGDMPAAAARPTLPPAAAHTFETPAPAAEQQHVALSTAPGEAAPARKSNRRSCSVSVDTICVPWGASAGVPILEASEPELERLESECRAALLEPSQPSKAELKRRIAAIRQVRKSRTLPFGDGGSTDSTEVVAVKS